MESTVKVNEVPAACAVVRKFVMVMILLVASAAQLVVADRPVVVHAAFWITPYGDGSVIFIWYVVSI